VLVFFFLSDFFTKKLNYFLFSLFFLIVTVFTKTDWIDNCFSWVNNFFDIFGTRTTVVKE